MALLLGVHIPGYGGCFCVPMCPWCSSQSRDCEGVPMSGQMCVWCSRGTDIGLTGTRCSVPQHVTGQGIVRWLSNYVFHHSKDEGMWSTERACPSQQPRAL